MKNKANLMEKTFVTDAQKKLDQSVKLHLVSGISFVLNGISLILIGILFLAFSFSSGIATNLTSISEFIGISSSGILQVFFLSCVISFAIGGRILFNLVKIIDR